MRNRFFWLLITIMMCGAVMTGVADDMNPRVMHHADDALGVFLLGAAFPPFAMYDFKTSFYLAPETPDGAVQQVDQLKKAINDGVKYIVLTAVDYKKINESGLLEQHPDVKVVCHDHRQEPEGHGV